jgi:hypothetical protein
MTSKSMRAPILLEGTAGRCIVKIVSLACPGDQGAPMVTMAIVIHAFHQNHIESNSAIIYMSVTPYSAACIHEEIVK